MSQFSTVLKHVMYMEPCVSSTLRISVGASHSLLHSTANLKLFLPFVVPHVCLYLMCVVPYVLDIALLLRYFCYTLSLWLRFS